jgi:hypothetical protein
MKKLLTFLLQKLLSSCILTNRKMDANSIEAGLENLCLDEELTRVMAARLGAIPKTCPPPPVAKNPLPASAVNPPMARLAPPSTPVVLRRAQKKKNRKDRRRNDAEDSGEHFSYFKCARENNTLPCLNIIDSNLQTP